jgi:hypothetical protein
VRSCHNHLSKRTGKLASVSHVKVFVGAVFVTTRTSGAGSQNLGVLTMFARGVKLRHQVQYGDRATLGVKLRHQVQYGDRATLARWHRIAVPQVQVGGYQVPSRGLSL